MLPRRQPLHAVEPAQAVDERLVVPGGGGVARGHAAQRGAEGVRRGVDLRVADEDVRVALGPLPGGERAAQQGLRPAVVGVLKGRAEDSTVPASSPVKPRR